MYLHVNGDIIQFHQFQLTIILSEQNLTKYKLYDS